jgi:hypothetical protein
VRQLAWYAFDLPDHDAIVLAESEAQSSVRRPRHGAELFVMSYVSGPHSLWCGARYETKFAVDASCRDELATGLPACRGRSPGNLESWIRGAFACYGSTRAQ